MIKMPSEIRRALNYQTKCVVCGDSTVGKSALIQVFCSDGVQYPKTYLMTTGVDLVTQMIKIPNTPDTVEFFLYDMAGKEEFDDLVHAHLKNVKTMILVYDVTNMESFENISNWHKTIETENSTNDNGISGILIANKCDLTDRQVVTSEMGRELAEQLHLEFFECSAKEMRNTEASFHALAQTFYHQYINTNPTTS